MVEEAIAANPKAVEEFRAGKEKALNALAGQVMKASKGKANPAQVQEILKQKLADNRLKRCPLQRLHERHAAACRSVFACPGFQAAGMLRVLSDVHVIKNHCVVFLHHSSS
jgi:hypothetical protein